MTEPLRRPIRVGFVLHVMQVAGAEVLVKETIRQLGPRIVPTIFCLDRVGTLGEEFVQAGGDLVCLNRKPGWDFRLVRPFAKHIRERGIDVLHAHQYTPFFYTALAKTWIHPMPRVILTEHGRHYPDNVAPARRAINRVVLDRLADAVNACSEFSARALCEIDGFTGRRIEVIANGIATERYQPVQDRRAAKQALGLDPSRRYIANVARHHPVKDQAMLIRGFAEFVRTNPQVDLVMVGDGPLRADLEALAAEQKVTERVHFLGIRSDVPQVLQAMDAFALTSVSEAASLTLLEAMAVGLPVVVTDVGGNPEIVRDGIEGILVPRGDAPACARAFATLFSDASVAQRLGEAGRERVLTQYRLESTINAYFGLYRRLTGL